MGPLGALVSALLASDVGHTVSRYKRNAALSVFAGVFFATAYVFALVAGGLYLSTLYTPLHAALILGGASLLIGLIIMGVMYTLSARDARLAAERRRRSMAQANLAVAASMTIFRRKPLLAAGLAVGVGALLGFTRKSRNDD
ncbi:hypothetical protein [Pararhizobium antarcticum]|uniref:Uncharacterized protein n=1 Tax=Pararhizobium antarcticum TaxID=1798805 RepID=A0A657LTQ4_9HYPH|nr:hypothetical protein [Pararhizobium antarcticum]OJF94341.1 hypothetical protein AX761_18615 [Rhizobium sp. 58]OJF96938.1 hypothetical protein AX760_03560 [Pararhizobium antarcticum]